MQKGKEQVEQYQRSCCLFAQAPPAAELLPDTADLLAEAIGVCSTTVDTFANVIIIRRKS